MRMIGDIAVFAARPSALRKNLAEFLMIAHGKTIIEVDMPKGEDNKYIVDKAFFDGLISNLKSATATIEVMSDRKLFEKILRAGDDLGKNDLARLEKLRTWNPTEDRETF